jgi:hypothetical protein
MDVVYELMKITIPAAIVGYLAYLLVRSFLQNKLDEVLITIRQRNQEVVIPIRLQAYERICLLLERISSPNLISRLNNGTYTASEFQTIMIHEIRQEFNHNLSQQVYMSAEAWTYVTGAVEQSISDINAAALNLGKEASGIDLARAIFEMESRKEAHATQQALNFIKEEIQTVF